MFGTIVYCIEGLDNDRLNMSQENKTYSLLLNGKQGSDRYGRLASRKKLIIIPVFSATEIFKTLDKYKVHDIIIKNIFMGTSCLQRMLVPLCFLKEIINNIHYRRRLNYGNSTSGTY